MTIPRTNGATVQAAQPDTTIYITRFANFTAHDGELTAYASWDAFFKALRNSTEGDDDNSVWSPCVFRNGFRRSSDVERVACMVLRCPSGQMDPSAAFEFWSENAFGGTTTCFLYTTSEFASPKPAFSVVIPFADPLSREEFMDASNAIVELATKHGHDVSASSRDLAATPSWATSRARCLGPREGSCLLNPRTMIPDVPPAPASSTTMRTTSSFSLEKWLAEIRTAAPADAGKTLNRNAFIAGLRIAKGNLDEAEASNDLIKAGVDAGVAAEKAAKVVQHAIQLGKHKSSEQGETWDAPRLTTTKSGVVEHPCDDKPEVKLDGELHERISDAMKALAEHPNVFQKDGKLFCIGKSVANGVELISMGETRVQEMMSECANWMVFAAKEKDYKKTQPPKRLAEHLVRRGDWEFIKPIHAVTAFPVLNPSGRLHSAKGFDETTKTYFASSVEVQVPEAPTVEDAKSAVGVLLDIVGDFPFVNDAHKSAWLAALLSPLSRYMHEGNIPLVVIQANDRRVGKSKLATIIGMIVTGKMPATMTHVANGEEERKRIGTVLMAGYPVVLIDNVESQFGTGGNMNALITSRVYMDRKLGENAALRAENNATWIVNGKNMTLAPDMAQRSLHIRLQCDEEKPELRDGFKYPNLERHVLEHRAELLGAALTILRGYVVAGMPVQNLSAWGSFESWSDLIRGALVWAGLPDPALTREELEEEADTELSFEIGIIEGWQEGLRHFEMPDGMTASEMLKRLDQNDSSVCPILREALGTITPPRMTLPTPKKLGYELSKVKRKVRNGLSIEPVGSGKDAMRWVVVPKT